MDGIFCVILTFFLRSLPWQTPEDNLIGDFILAVILYSVCKFPFMIMFGGWHYPFPQDTDAQVYASLLGFAVSTCFLRYLKARMLRRQSAQDLKDDNE